MADRFCPTCHSRIGDDSTPINELSREQGSEGFDDNNDPVPRWSFDPVRTLDAFNGPDFQDTQRALVTEILELQEDRIVKEEEAGLSGDQLTDFSDPNIGLIREAIINELRESTEKILDNNGSNLTEYFSLDADGLPAIEPGPNDLFKDEWTDVTRGRSWVHKDGENIGNFNLPTSGQQASPSLPANTRVRAIHLEDLRRTLVPGWKEFWSVHDSSNLFDVEKGLKVETLIEFESGINPPPQGTLFQKDTTERTSFFIEPFTDKDGNFPVEAFDIHPTDGGARFTIPNTDPPEKFYLNEKTWLVRANTSNGKFTRFTALTPNIPQAPTQTSTAFAAAVGTAVASIEDAPEQDNPEAKALVLSSTGESSAQSGLQSSTVNESFEAGGNITAYHRWQGDSVPFLDTVRPLPPDIFAPQLPLPDATFQNIKINQNTRFVAKVNTTYNRTWNPPNDNFFIDGDIQIGSDPAPFGLPTLSTFILLRLLIDNFTFFIRIRLGIATRTGKLAGFPFFNDTSITENTVSALGIGAAEWSRGEDSANYIIDINIDKLLIKHKEEIGSPYNPQTIIVIVDEEEKIVPNPNASVVLFRSIELQAFATADSRNNSIGTFTSSASNTTKISALQILNQPGP